MNLKNYLIYKKNIIMELNIEQFNPKREELLALVEQYKWLKIKWIDDKAWYEVVKRARINLKKTRCDIDNTGKAMREEANKFSKLVKQTADWYIAIIEAEEERLKQEEDNYNQLILIEKRKEDLPFRKAQLEWLGDLSDDEILSYDDRQFAEVIFEFKQAKLAKEQAELEAEKARIAEQERIKEQEEQRAREIKEAELRATQEAERKAQEQIEQLKKEAEEKEQARIAEEKKKEQEKIEAERKAEQEVESMRKNEEYKQFLKENNYNQDTDKIERDWQTIRIYRLVAETNIQ